jgi:hypothetical protein
VRGDQLLRDIGNCRIVAETGKPRNIRLAPEPSELALSVAASGLDDRSRCIGKACPTSKVLTQRSIADEVQRLAIGWDAAANQFLDFFEPSSREHFIRATFDSLIQRCARRSKTYANGRKPHERVTAREMNLGNGLACEDTYFDRAHKLLAITRGDSPRCFWIEARENAMEISRAPLCPTCFKTRTQFGRALRRIGKSFEKRPEIQARADGKYRQAAACSQVSQNDFRAAPIFSCGEYFRRFDQVQQVVRDAAALRSGRLRSADVESALDLR